MSKPLMTMMGVLALTGCEEIAASIAEGGASEPSTAPQAGGERVPWCHQGDIHDSPTIEWDAVELAAMMASYGTDTWSTTDISIAHGTTDAYCADVYSLGALQGAGEMVVTTSPSSSSYGEAGGGLGPLSLPSTYALTDGLTFTCELCGYYPVLELDDEPVDVGRASSMFTPVGDPELPSPARTNTTLHHYLAAAMETQPGFGDTS
ncbi:MAG: hypothetical protein AAF211_29035, partial [Myxococcota bacterium]